MNTRIASVDKSEKANILLLFSDKRFEKKNKQKLQTTTNNHTFKTRHQMIWLDSLELHMFYV